MAEKLSPDAEEVSIALRRAYPEEVEAAELADQTGLNNQELKAALDELRGRGALNEEGEHYAWLDPEDPERVPEPAGGSGSGEETPPGEGGGGPAAGYRATLTLVVNFSGPRGENRDQAAAASARQLETEVANALAEAGLAGAVVDLQRLEAVDVRPVDLE